MRATAVVLVVTLCACAPSTPLPTAPPDAERGATVFVGARLLSGTSDPPIEDSAFVVEKGRFAFVGARSAVIIPEGAAWVDLTGKTVMPAMIDGHSHIGYVRGTTSGPANYTRENIIDHMHRFAYYGVAASQAMGSDFGLLPYLMQRSTGRRSRSSCGPVPDRRPRPRSAIGDQPLEHAPRGLRGDD